MSTTDVQPHARTDTPPRVRLCRRVPRAGGACALVAVLNALAWALITPPFEVPDETQHFSYTQTIVEAGRLPRPLAIPSQSPEEREVTKALDLASVGGNPVGRPPWTRNEAARLHAVLDSGLSRIPPGGFSNVTNYPPLYYAAEAVPYLAARDGSIFDRLMAMRILSALLSGVTVLMTFLFLRELLPGTPWAWTAGALVAAVQPTFGFVSGGVNNDVGLWTASAIVFWLLARVFRRGLNAPRALALGLALGTGVCVKPNLLGFFPGIALGLLVLIARAGRSRRRTALGSAALTALGIAAPIGIVLAINVGFDRPLWTGGDPTKPVTSVSTTWTGLLSYFWQSYLPRLWFLKDQVHEYVLWTDWFKGFVGRFGWLDTTWRPWVYDLALGVFTGIACLVAAELAKQHAALRARAGEFATYFSMTIGLLAMIAAAGYSYRLSTDFAFEQARYLLPLLPLYAALIALAARGAGRRWGPAAGAVMVVLALGHGLFAQLLVVSRFYG